MTRIKLSLRAMLACVLMWCALAIGCSYPDDSNWDHITNVVAGISPESLNAIAMEEHAEQFRRWYDRELKDYLARKGDVQKKNLQKGEALKANEKIQQDTENFTKKTFLSVTCTDGEDEKSFDFPLIDFYFCMLRQIPVINSKLVTYRGFDQCISEHVDLAERTVTMEWGSHTPSQFDSDGNPLSTDSRCKPKIARDFSTILDEGLSDKYTAEDLTRILVSAKSPPPWAEIIGIAIVGGVVIIAAPEIAVVLCALGADYACPPSADKLPGQTPQPGGDR